MHVSEADVNEYRRTGVVVLRSVLAPAEVARLGQWVDEVAAGAPAVGLHHFEQTDAGPTLARSERFTEHHEGLAGFVCGPPLTDLLARLVGAPVVLFKEKVNYKQPGGGGFAPHQDAAAYRFVDRHLSVMVPLDPSTVRSGCLWFAAHPTLDRLPTDERGRIEQSVADTLDWRPVEVQPGDLVVFDSHAPHRSDTNRSDRPRRAMYLTYNEASLGDFRAAYYADKEAELAAAGDTFGGERVRISISDDFLGRPVDGATPPLAELLDLFASPATLRLYDESVTELDHALQAAALAEAEGAPAELVAAALLHDVGHLVVGDLVPLDRPLDGDAHHEAVGARHLRRWFGPAVTDPVALHVAAKRYLCAVDAGYHAGLSPSSVRSLEAQGGPMSPAEAAAFEANPRSRGGRAAAALGRRGEGGRPRRGGHRAVGAGARGAGGALIAVLFHAHLSETGERGTERGDVSRRRRRRGGRWRW